MKQIVLIVFFFQFNVEIVAQKNLFDHDEYITKFKNDLNLASVSVAMVKGQEIAWKGAFGMANIEESIDATTKRLYILGSVSKLFTGATLLKLYEDTALDLDDDVDKYLPFSVRNPNYPNTPITIRMLLTHSSSIGDYQELQDSLYGPGDSNMSLSEVSEDFFDPRGKFYRPENFHEYQPGSAYEYSNWNFVLIGYLIEKISGKSFADYSSEVLLKPLEMNTAGWFLKEVEEDNIATLYGLRDNGEKYPVYNFGWPGYSDGQLRTNVEEATNFLIMILNNGSFNGNQVLKSETVVEMLRLQGVKNMPANRIDMGLAWHTVAVPDTVYIHSGNPTGTEIFMAFNPKTNSGFVSFITGYSYKTQGVDDKITSYYLYLLEQSGTY